MIRWLFLSAIALMLIGHIFKTQRWKQFVAVYEKPDTDTLINALANGHAWNQVLPLRIGDLVRILLAGKKMKNGYIFAIATVAVDLYLDLITVGFVFTVFWIFHVGAKELELVEKLYSMVFIVLVPLTLLGFYLSKHIKKLIQRISSLFNDEIGLKILYLSWAMIGSLKDIVRKLKKVELIFYTTGMWAAYFLSYLCFARSMSRLGIQTSTSRIFGIMFTENCFSLLWKSHIRGLSIISMPVMIFVYMMIPLFLILTYIILKRELIGKKQKEDVKGSSFQYLLPHLNANEKLAFLESYFNDKGRENIDLYLHINQDVNIIRDYSAGSNATTMLCMNQENTFYRKYAFGKDAVKLQEQISWLEIHESILPLPEIISENSGENYCSYDMDYNARAVGFFQLIHSAPYEVSWKILNQALLILKNELHSRNIRKADSNIIREYIEKKVTENIRIIKHDGKHLKQLMDYETIIINGKPYNNLEYYLKNGMLSSANLYCIFEEDIYSDIHGDMTIENIICVQDEEPSFYFIDPNTGNIHDSPFLDYSKLLQSLHGGYEFLMSTQIVEVEGNHISFLFIKSSAYTQIYNRYKEFLFKNFTRREVRSIYYHEIVHWLRLMPYKIRKDDKKELLFYAGVLMVLDDVNGMFN